MKNKWWSLLDRFSSVKLTIFCLILAMAVILLGTIAQVRMGTFAAQKEFFNSFLLFADFDGLKIPIFPGGLSVGALWMVNLLAAFAVRFKFKKSDVGILISHFGLMVLLMGQFLTQSWAVETQLPLEVGQTGNFVQSFRDTEIALVRTSSSQGDVVTGIPYSVFSRRQVVHVPGSSLSLRIKKLYRNASLQMGGGASGTLATQGIGPQIEVQALPPVSSDEETNNVTAYVEVSDAGKSLGTWLISTGLGAPQAFSAAGASYQIYLRARRFYLPFSLTLKEFRHDVYPGTDIPKNFSSLVRLVHTAKNENRDVLIYMNHPLRYGGWTFYQASFGNNDQLSIFQAVQNPAWITPYVACALVTLGLAIQFMSHLFSFLKTRS